MVCPFIIRTIAVAAALAALTGCAVFYPTFDVPPPQTDPALTIEAKQADPDGLLLALVAKEAQPGEELEIWRQIDDSDWTMVQTIGVEEYMTEALATGNLQWRDAIDDEPSRRRYRLEKIGTDDHRASQPVDVEWRGWPRRPSAGADTDITDDTSPQVVLHWDDDAPFEARIMRRDVLTDAPFEALAIVDAAAGARFVDDHVNPGGVYAYQIQFVDRLSPLLRSGPYTEPLYVSVPEKN